MAKLINDMAETNHINVEKFNKVLQDNGGLSYLGDTMESMQILIEITARNCYSWRGKDPELLYHIEDCAIAMGNALHLLSSLTKV
ncbi:MAG: hypothetical protein IJ607_10695 [Bacteroidaceae bacterium]|nr:hypothetical protein [Bacteroidaceae bacterium]